jgi:hypothetical protein
MARSGELDIMEMEESLRSTLLSSTWITISLFLWEMAGNSPEGWYYFLSGEMAWEIGSYFYI